MSGIRKIMVGEREILCVDYSDLKVNQIIALASEAMELVLNENHPVFILNIFNENNFATPKVMRHFENTYRQGMQLVKKRAILGLSPRKEKILEGFNFVMKGDSRAFNQYEEAIQYLLSD